MGVTVRQKRKGKGQPWHVFIHRNRTIRSKRVGDKKVAEAVAGKLRKKLLSGQLGLGEAKQTPLFADYARHFMEDYAKVACKRNTWKSYETMIALHLLPVWKNKRLNEIRRADVKKLLLAEQQAGFAVKTVENIKALVSGIFTHAYEEDILQANPALRLGRFIQKDDRRKHLNPWTKEQVTAFLATARVQAPDYYALFLCACRTGMRMGELLGLAWEDIDFQANRIEIRRSYSHGHFSSPKSHKSRPVDMSDQLGRDLLAHRGSLVQKFGGTVPVVDLGAGFKPDQIRLVFPNREGGPLDGDNVRRRAFYRTLKNAGVPRIRFHDLRHTFASLLLQQGESLHYVKEQMGHASIQTTVDVYGHIVPGSNRRAVNLLDDQAGGLRIVPNAS